MTKQEIYAMESGDKITITMNGKYKSVKINTVEVKYNLACIFTLEGDYIECFLEEIQ